MNEGVWGRTWKISGCPLGALSSECSGAQRLWGDAVTDGKWTFRVIRSLLFFCKSWLFQESERKIKVLTHPAFVSCMTTVFVKLVLETGRISRIQLTFDCKGFLIF